MYLPRFTRVLKEDLGPDAPPWSDKVIYQTNVMTDYLNTAFAKGITLQDNLQNPVRTLQFTAGATPDLNRQKFSVVLPAGYQPIGVTILNCIDLAGVIVGAAVTCEMQPGLEDGSVVIRAIYGLTDQHDYSITFLVW